MSKHNDLKEIPAETQFDDTEPCSGSIFLVAIVTIVFILISIGCVFGYYSWYREKSLYERQLAPTSVDLTAIRTKEDQLLNSYGYVEKDKGIIRLPVARAIELVMMESAEGKEKYPTAAKLIPPPKVEDSAVGSAVVVAAPGAPTVVTVPAVKH